MTGTTSNCVAWKSGIRAFKCAVVGVVLGTCLSPARADIDWGLNHDLNDTLYLWVGATYLKTNGQAQLNSTTTGVGTNIDLQNTLGMDDNATGPYLGLRWRMSERWRLEASYLEIKQNGTKSIDQDIHWGDVTYPINATVDSHLFLADLRTSVGYSFYKTSDKEIGVGFGLHTLSYQLSLKSANQGTEAADVLAPLPVLSLYGGFALNSEWSVDARLDWFSLTYQQYHGGITAMGFEVLYQPFRHVGFGAGWKALFINFQATSGSFEGKLTQSYQGPQLFVTVSF